MSIADQLRELATDLDLYSFTINDGYVAKIAADIESIANRIDDDSPQ